jgi:hypothetical protein
METFRDAPFPPSLDGKPFLAMVIVTALLVGTALCLQWLYAIIDEARSGPPAPRRHPIRAYRAIRSLFIVACLACTLPRLIQVMCWQTLSPAWREAMSVGSWLIYVVWALCLAAGWWIDRMSRPVIDYQLHRVPAPETRGSDAAFSGKRGEAAVIMALIVITAFATTFIRPDIRAQRPGIFQRG